MVPARCKKSPTNPTPKNPTTNKTPNPIRILAPGINIIHGFGACIDVPLDFLREIPFYFTKLVNI